MALFEIAENWKTQIPVNCKMDELLHGHGQTLPTQNIRESHKNVKQKQQFAEVYMQYTTIKV